MTTLYSPRQYYARIKMFLKEYRPQRRKTISQLKWWHIWAWIRSMWFLGVTGQGRVYYWRFVLSTLARRPRSFPISMILAVYGFHFWTVIRKLQYV